MREIPIAVPLPSDVCPRGGVERRRSPRDPHGGDLWLIDNRESAVLPCTCIDLSPHGMRLRLTDTVGVEPRREYELCSNLPGHSAPPGIGTTISRRVSIVWMRPLGAHADAGIECGVEVIARSRPLARPRRTRMVTAAAPV
ncbi:MAG: PilZ domain-containing protein [Phycisphaerae bacterium]|jgi:hypothetical protein